MVCKYCGSSNLRTIDSRPSGNNSTRRRKECLNCGERFSTYEMTADGFINENMEFRNGLKAVLLETLDFAFKAPITDMERHGRD